MEELRAVTGTLAIRHAKGSIMAYANAEIKMQSQCTNDSALSQFITCEGHTLEERRKEGKQ